MVALVSAPTPVTVVVVHRDEPDHAVRTGRALLAQPGVDVRLLVVDNGSSGASLERLRRGLPGVEVLALGANHGFGPAANRGLRRWLGRGGGEWVALAPHDVLPGPRCLARLVEVAGSRPRAGLASAEFGDALVPVVDPYFGGIQLPASRGGSWQPAGFPHGSLMLARRACLEDVGLFDERYFAYGEEADLAVRARRAGWEVGVVWEATVENADLSSPVRVVDYLQFRNSLLLVRSHFGRYRTFIRTCFAAANTLRLLVRSSERPPVFDVPARLLGVLDFYRGRFGPPPLRLWRRSARPRAPTGP